MTRQTKIIIGVVGAVLVLCLAICVVGVLGFGLFTRNVTSSLQPNPEKAAQTASQIADLTPPEGYQPTSAMNFLGYTFVFYTDPADTSTNRFMMLMQMPLKGDISESTIQQMQQGMERQTGRNLSNMHTIETRDVTIRGKPARVIVQEGTYAESSTPIRQMLVAFQGKGGLAMLAVTAPAADWNQEAFDAMVNSIH